MSALTLGLPVIPTEHLRLRDLVLANGMVFAHPARIAQLQGGTPGLIAWMTEHAYRRIDALADGRPVPPWPAA